MLAGPPHTASTPQQAALPAAVPPAPHALLWLTGSVTQRPPR